MRAGDPRPAHQLRIVPDDSPTLGRFGGPGLAHLVDQPGGRPPPRRAMRAQCVPQQQRQRCGPARIGHPRGDAEGAAGPLHGVQPVGPAEDCPRPGRGSCAAPAAPQAQACQGRGFHARSPVDPVTPCSGGAAQSHELITCAVDPVAHVASTPRGPLPPPCAAGSVFARSARGRLAWSRAEAPAPSIEREARAQSIAAVCRFAAAFEDRGSPRFDAASAS